MLLITGEDEDGMITLPQDAACCSKEKVPGDRYIICHFSFSFGTMVDDSDNNLGELMKRVPEHVFCEDDQSLSIAEVSEWRRDKHDSSSFIPYRLKTLMEITGYNEPSEE